MTRKLPKIAHHKDQLKTTTEFLEKFPLPPDQLSLAQWAANYMEHEVIGIQSLNTISAKLKAAKTGCSRFCRREQRR